MKTSYILSVTREGVCLYGGRLDNRGSYAVFDRERKKTVEDFCAHTDIPVADRADTMLGIIFSQSFSGSEQNRLLGLLSDKGFVNQRLYDYHEELCKTIKGQPYALVLSADNDDLLVDLRETNNGQQLAATIIPTAGRDPRVRVLADCIWQKLLSDASYLNRDDQESNALVTAKAKEFLRSGKAEIDSSVYLEGDEREFFIRRKDAEIDNVLDYGCNSVLATLGTFAERNELQRSETVLVLADNLSGNPYFSTIFNGFVTDMMEVCDKLRADLLTRIISDLYGNTSESIVAGALSLRSIHARPKENAIDFTVDFPKDVTAIEVYRDGELIRTITESKFTDDDLLPDHQYLYSFVMVITDEAGYRKKSAEVKKAINTTPIQLPDPVSLKVKDGVKDAILTWNDAARGEVKVFVSTKPFDLHRNDRISMAQFEYTPLAALGNRYVVVKDFCGERFYLPVTVVGNMGVAGEQRRVTSMVTPEGVRVDSTNVSHVKAIWLWEDVPMVRVQWGTGDGNDQWKDLVNKNGQKPELELTLSAKVRNFTVSISSLYKASDGELLQSEPYTMNVTISPVRVDFLKAKPESRFFFMHKDEYSVTLKADGEPPCDLYVLIQEGSMPLDLTNFQSHLTIPHQELADGKVKKFPLTYHRQQKHKKLYFRIIGANPNLPMRVTPETQTIN